MAEYSQHASRLAIEAARDALTRSGVAAQRVTHLVCASCTGFRAPGFDQALIPALPIAHTVRRTHIGFMGCHAAINALAVADAICRADRSAVALVCCVELCSLHFHYGARVDRLIANALFADGAAAAVITAGDDDSSGPTLGAFAAGLWPEAASAMDWTVGDHGFEMSLSPAVPDILASRVRDWLSDALRPRGLALSDIKGWAIHPGGPRIVRAVGEALDLAPDDLAPSLDILRRHGNMSSPTVLFILRELARRETPRPWIAMAFGPGLAAEAALIR